MLLATFLRTTASCTRQSDHSRASFPCRDLGSGPVSSKDRFSNVPLQPLLSPHQPAVSPLRPSPHTGEERQGHAHGEIKEKWFPFNWGEAFHLAASPGLPPGESSNWPVHAPCTLPNCGCTLFREACMALTGYYTVNNEEMGFRYEAIRHKLVVMREKLRGCGMDPLLYCCLLCQSWIDLRHILFTVYY